MATNFVYHRNISSIRVDVPCELSNQSFSWLVDSALLVLWNKFVTIRLESARESNFSAADETEAYLQGISSHVNQPNGPRSEECEAIMSVGCIHQLSETINSTNTHRLAESARSPSQPLTWYDRYHTSKHTRTEQTIWNFSCVSLRFFCTNIRSAYVCWMTLSRCRIVCLYLPERNTRRLWCTELVTGCWNCCCEHTLLSLSLSLSLSPRFCLFQAIQ